MTAKTSPNGLYQHLGFGSRVCSDCVGYYLEVNMSMERRDWVPADTDPFDNEHCDSCDCVPVAKGKVTA